VGPAVEKKKLNEKGGKKAGKQKQLKGSSSGEATKTGMATRRWKKKCTQKNSGRHCERVAMETAKEVNYWTKVPMMFN